MLLDILDSELVKALPCTVVTLDCTGIKIIDYTGADECFVTLMRRLQRRYGDIYIILAGLTPSQEHNIEVAVSRARGQMLVQRGTTVDMIGHLEAYLREGWAFLLTRPKSTARDLADALDIRISLAATKLLYLYQKRLVQRYPKRLPRGGLQFVYSVVKG